MPIRTFVRVAMLGATALLLATCKDSASPPPPGWLSVRLITPNFDDGGVFFTIDGAHVDSVRSHYPHLVSRAESETVHRIVVGGIVNGGEIAEIWVDDTRSLDRYVTTVHEVAVRGTFAQRPITGYSIELSAAR
jgi:hypothetical protein